MSWIGRNRPKTKDRSSRFSRTIRTRNNRHASAPHERTSMKAIDQFSPSSVGRKADVNRCLESWRVTDLTAPHRWRGPQGLPGGSAVAGSRNQAKPQGAITTEGEGHSPPDACYRVDS